MSALLHAARSVSDRVGLDSGLIDHLDNRIYLYFRHPDTKKLTALPLDRASVEFKRHYDQCVKALTASRGPAKPAPLPTEKVMAARI
jgi:hypothetical protein